MNIQHLIASLEHTPLSGDDMRKVQREVISGQLSQNDILRVFSAFERRAITVEELEGVLTATRESMVRIVLNDGDSGGDCARVILDTCGTGGDRLNTFNISTAAAVVCAAAGVPVAKHGNRAASSQCGSADVLEALGIDVMMSPEAARKCFVACGIVFLFAPLYHPALKHVKAARVAYGKATYFNVIGPMLNPMMATHQVIGVSDWGMVALMGPVLMQTGSQRVVFVQGKDGLDEVSISGPTRLSLWEEGRWGVESVLDASEFGISGELSDLTGGTAAENATILRTIFDNKAHPSQSAAVLLNAAISIYCVGRCATVDEGYAMAKECLESGKVQRKFQEWVAFSGD